MFLAFNRAKERVFFLKKCELSAKYIDKQNKRKNTSINVHEKYEINVKIR